MVVMGHTMSYLKVRRNVRLVWLKVVRLRQVGKEWFFKSFQTTPYESIRTEKSQEDLDHRELDMAVLYVRFISVREELAGKSILSYQRLRIRIIVRNLGSLYNAGKRKTVGLLGACEGSEGLRGSSIGKEF